MAPLPPGDVFAKNVQGMRGVSRAKGALIRGELYASKHRHATGKKEKIQKDKINLVLCWSSSFSISCAEITRDVLPVGAEDGEPLTLENACQLKRITFGGSNFPLEDQLFWIKISGGIQVWSLTKF